MSSFGGCEQRGSAVQADGEAGNSEQAAPDINLSGRRWRERLWALTDGLRAWWAGTLFPGDDGAQEPGGKWFGAGLASLAVFAGAMLLLDLHYPLLEPDEGRYAEVVREMLARGDWVVPTLNRQPFYDKPPLFYWLVGGSFHVFG